MKRSLSFLAVLVLLFPQVLFSASQSFSGCCANQLVLRTLASTTTYVDVNVSEAKQLIETDPSLTILDVRTLEEYESGHIRNATFIPLTELTSRLGELNKEKGTLVYCRSGGRSATASQMLVDNGFSKVYNMLGGITAWRNAECWIEIVHSGDLVMDGTQTIAIENCTYIQNGGIYVRDHARLILRNCELQPNQTYPWEYSYSVENYGTLEIENSTLASDRALTIDFNEQSEATFNNTTLNLTRASLRFHDFSKATIHQSTILQWHGLAFDSYSQASMTNSYISQVQVEVGAAICKIKATNSSISVFSINLDPDSSAKVNHLKPGFHEYLDLQQVAVHDVQISITLNNTRVDEWAVHTDYNSETIISDSIVGRLGIYMRNLSVSIDGLNPIFYDYTKIGRITLNQSMATGITLFIEDSVVTISNSTLHLYPSSKSKLFLKESVVSLQTGESNFTGSLGFEKSTLRGAQIFYTDFYVYGNVTFDLWGINWFSSSSIRNYNTIVKDLRANPVENTGLTLFDHDNTIVWSGTTDSLGEINFNVTFTDGNYTDTLKLKAFKEGFYNVTEYIKFLSDTPISINLTQKPLGDINEDHVVNILDIFVVANAFGATPNDANWNATADLNKDGIIDILDIFAVARDYGMKV